MSQYVAPRSIPFGDQFHAEAEAEIHFEHAPPGQRDQRLLQRGEHQAGTTALHPDLHGLTCEEVLRPQVGGGDTELFGDIPQDLFPRLRDVYLEARHGLYDILKRLLCTVRNVVEDLFGLLDLIIGEAEFLCNLFYGIKGIVPSAGGTEGFAEVLTGGGWRAITRDSNGVIGGPGNMDYAHDMPPYVQQIADWLDDDAKVHPCNGESAFKGFQIAMAIVRSVIQRGKVALPLGPGEPEMAALERVLAQK